MTVHLIRGKNYIFDNYTWLLCFHKKQTLAAGQTERMIGHLCCRTRYGDNSALQFCILVNLLTVCL